MLYIIVTTINDMKNIIATIIVVFTVTTFSFGQQINNSFSITRKVETVTREDGMFIDCSNFHDRNGQYWWLFEFTYNANTKSAVVKVYDQRDNEPVKINRYSGIKIIKTNGSHSYSIQDENFIHMNFVEEENGNYSISYVTEFI